MSRITSQVGLNPQARLVDTFVSPGIAAPRSNADGQQLVNALAGFSSSLAQIADRGLATQHEKMVQDAQGLEQLAAAKVKNREDFKAFVDAGKIRWQDNPWAEVYGRSLAGRNLVDARARDLEQEATTNGLMQQNDSGKVHAFFMDGLSAAADMTDAHVAAAILPRIDEIANSKANAHATLRSRARVEEFGNQLASGLQTGIETGDIAGLQSELDRAGTVFDQNATADAVLASLRNYALTGDPLSADRFSKVQNLAHQLKINGKAVADLPGMAHHLEVLRQEEENRTIREAQLGETKRALQIKSNVDNAVALVNAMATFTPEYSGDISKIPQDSINKITASLGLEERLIFSAKMNGLQANELQMDTMKRTADGRLLLNHTYMGLGSQSLPALLKSPSPIDPSQTLGQALQESGVYPHAISLGGQATALRNLEAADRDPATFIDAYQKVDSGELTWGDVVAMNLSGQITDGERDKLRTVSQNRLIKGPNPDRLIPGEHGTDPDTATYGSGGGSGGGGALTLNNPFQWIHNTISASLVEARDQWNKDNPIALPGGENPFKDLDTTIKTKVTQAQAQYLAQVLAIRAKSPRLEEDAAARQAEGQDALWKIIDNHTAGRFKTPSDYLTMQTKAPKVDEAVAPASPADGSKKIAAPTAEQIAAAADRRYEAEQVVSQLGDMVGPWTSENSLQYAAAQADARLATNTHDVLVAQSRFASGKTYNIKPPQLPGSSDSVVAEQKLQHLFGQIQAASGADRTQLQKDLIESVLAYSSSAEDLTKQAKKNNDTRVLVVNPTRAEMLQTSLILAGSPGIVLVRDHAGLKALLTVLKNNGATPQQLKLISDQQLKLFDNSIRYNPNMEASPNGGQSGPVSLPLARSGG